MYLIQPEILPLCLSKSWLQINLTATLEHALYPLYTIALGCPNLNAPKDGWLLRKGSELVIGCNNTKQTWHLLCKGLHWTGVIGNCSMSE